MTLQYKSITELQSCQVKLAQLKASSKVDPQPDKGTVRVANEIWEALYKIRFTSVATLPLILWVIRYSWGWRSKKTNAEIIAKHNVDKELPFKKQAISLARKEAEMLNIVVIDRKQGKLDEYAFNKYYDTWFANLDIAYAARGISRKKSSQPHHTSIVEKTSVVKHTSMTQHTTKAQLTSKAQLTGKDDES